MKHLTHKKLMKTADRVQRPLIIAKLIIDTIMGSLTGRIICQIQQLNKDLTSHMLVGGSFDEYGRAFCGAF